MTNGEHLQPKDGKKRRGWGRLVTIWGGATAFIGAVAALLGNFTSIMADARALPSEFRRTSDQFLSWYHDDAGWSGYWTNNPEGYVDLADMNLSSEKMAIDLIVKNGEIDGTISTLPICNAVPFDFLLLKGNVSGGKSANVIVWDIFDGHKQDIAMLELHRGEDGVMTAIPKEGSIKLFPKSARLAVDPSSSRKAGDSSEEFCQGKTEAMMKALSKLSAAQGAKQN